MSEANQRYVGVVRQENSENVGREPFNGWYNARELIDSGQVDESTISIGSDGKEYKRHHETGILDKYALFTVEEYDAVRNHINSVNDIDELKEIIHNLREERRIIDEVLLELEAKFNELHRNNKK